MKAVLDVTLPLRRRFFSSPNSSMPTSYPESAKRHLRDAEFLCDSHDVARLPNASQLFGFSAECALKAVLIGLGVPTNPAHGGVAKRKEFGHLPGLWQQFSAYAGGQLGGKYLAALQPAAGTVAPFANWSVDDRYAPDTWLAARNPDVTDHRANARDCMALLELAQEDGIVL